MPTEKDCQLCGKRFKPKESKIKTCSPKCGYALQQRNRAAAKTRDLQSGESMVEESAHNGDTWQLTKRTTEPIRNDRDLIRVLEIDESLWAISSWKAKTWEGYAKVGPAGQEQIETVQLHGVTATLKRREEVAQTKDFLSRLYQDYSRIGPRVAKFKAPAFKQTGNLSILSIFDHHFGLQAWGKETGWQDYDLDIATKKWWEAVDRAVQRTSIFKPEKIILLLGGDLLHVDSRRNTTTAGTLQDVDTRYIKVYKYVRTTVADTATRLAANVAPVEVVAVPGNHDADSTLTLVDALGCFFDGHKHIKIEQAPRSRKVIEWGVNGIMAAHGDNAESAVKLKQLANVFAAEFREVWGRTKIHEILTGHKHTEEVHDYHGCIIRRFPSLSPPSAWASGAHFVGSVRGAYGSTFHATDGLVDLMRYTPREDL